MTENKLKKILKEVNLIYKIYCAEVNKIEAENPGLEIRGVGEDGYVDAAVGKKTYIFEKGKLKELKK